jgi:glycosyltransferase involved in cell wall biosynthesis
MSRIALISEHASPLAWLGGADSGGQNVYVGQLARHLASRGHQVDVFTRRDRPELPEQVLLPGGVRVVHVPAGPAVSVRKEDMLPLMDEFSDFVREFCQRDTLYDMVHANFFMSALVASDLRRWLGIPYVVTFHALGRVRRLHQGSADEFPEERLVIEDAVVEEANHIIAECPQDLADLVELYGADKRRITIIPCGFDPAEIQPIDRSEARRQLGWDSSEPVILQLGRMVQRKGVENVIRAVVRLRRVHGIRCRLAIVGGETRKPDPIATPEIGRLMAICREERIEDSVTFVGNRGRVELATYYSAADIFVTTPWYEPFGITPLEAMACALPVVGSNVGGIKMSVADGQTGFLVPPRDPVALADRLALLIANPRLRMEFGRRGEHRVRRLFTWERVTKAIERLYADGIETAEATRATALPDSVADAASVGE